MILARQCVRRRASGQSPSGDVGLAIMVYYFLLNALAEAGNFIGNCCEYEAFMTAKRANSLIL
jgi:hypothetical protein